MKALKGSLDDPLRRKKVKGLKSSIDDPLKRNRTHSVKNVNIPIVDKKHFTFSTLAEFAEQPLNKWTLQDLLQMQELTREERVWQVHETLKVGFARCVIHLQTLPFGFCDMPSIQKVTSDYITDFHELMLYEQRHSSKNFDDDEYFELQQNIHNRHRGTTIDVARGVFEFRRHLAGLFGSEIDLAACRTEIGVLRDIEHSLNEFFTNRCTQRLVVQHVRSLNTGSAGLGGSNESMNELWFGDMNQMNDQHKANPKDMVGIVNTKTQPIRTLIEAYQAAKFICTRDFGAAPELLVNGLEGEEFLQNSAENQWEVAHVRTILFYVFYELMKNSARASLECSMDLEDKGSINHSSIPPIRVTVPDDFNSVGEELNPAVLKLADAGLGMSPPVLSKAWSYFFSSVKDYDIMSAEASDFDRGSPLAGYGFGLPISRVMARYFSGDLDMNSIPGMGTDVYVYL